MRLWTGKCQWCKKIYFLKAETWKRDFKARRLPIIWFFFSLKAVYFFGVRIQLFQVFINQWHHSSNGHTGIMSSHKYSVCDLSWIIRWGMGGGKSEITRFPHLLSLKHTYICHTKLTSCHLFCFISLSSLFLCLTSSLSLACITNYPRAPPKPLIEAVQVKSWLLMERNQIICHRA